MEFDKLDRSGRMQALRANYQKHNGAPFEHFFCPILKVDQKVDMSDGHIVPANQGVSNLWVPQRTDVDNFYGSVFEADFKVASDIINGQLSFGELLTQRPNRGPKVAISVDGKPVEFYYPRKQSEPVSGHTRGKLVIGEEERDIAFKIPSGELFSADEKVFQVHIDHNALPELTATVLKSAFLTMFRAEGYNLIYTSSGVLLSDILRKPFLDFYGRRPNEFRDAVREHFSKWIHLIRRMPRCSESMFSGSLLDGRYLGVCGASDKIFAIGVVVPMSCDLFCVFLPTEQDPTLATYFGFLNEPPSEIGIRLLEASPVGGDDPFEFVWHKSKEIIRVPFVPPLA